MGVAQLGFHHQHVELWAINRPLVEILSTEIILLKSILHYGPMVRSVRDAALMQNVMSGQHPDDICSLPEKVTIPEQLEGIKGFKVALSVDLGYVHVDPEVERNTRAAAAAFKELGCTVEEVDVGWDWGVLDCWMTWWEGLFAAIAGDLLPRWQYEMEPYVVRILEKGLTHDATRLYRCNLKRGDMWRKLQPILSNYDILICPTLAVPSVKADHDEFNTKFTDQWETCTGICRLGDDSWI